MTPAPRGVGAAGRQARSRARARGQPRRAPGASGRDPGRALTAGGRAGTSLRCCPVARPRAGKAPASSCVVEDAVAGRGEQARSSADRASCREARASDPGAVALQGNRPGGQDPSGVMGDPSGLGRVAVRAAKLAAQAVDVVDAPMPAHGAMLELGTTLIGRARRRARPAAPLLHSVLLLAGGLLPALTQGRQCQISCQAPAAKPDRAPRPVAGPGSATE